MPKTRLYARAREILIKYADSLLVCPEEAAAERRALVALQAAADEVIVAAFPPAHMDLLAKYEASYVRDSWPGSRIHFSLHPVRLTPRSLGCRDFDRFAPNQDAVAAAHVAWEKAVAIHKAARTAALAPYKALVNGSRTFEDVVEVWPEAIAKRSALGVPVELPSVVTPEMRDLIARDVERRRNARPPHHVEIVGSPS